MATTARNFRLKNRFSSFSVDTRSGINKLLKTQNIIVKPDALARSKVKFKSRIDKKKKELFAQRNPDQNKKIESFRKNFANLRAGIKGKQPPSAPATHRALLKKMITDAAFYSSHFGQEINKKIYLNPTRKRDLNVMPLQFIITLKKPLSTTEFQSRIMNAFGFTDPQDLQKNNISISKVFTSFKRDEYYNVTINTPVEFFSNEKLKLAKALNSLGDFKSTVPNDAPYKPPKKDDVAFRPAPKSEYCCCCCDGEHQRAEEDKTDADRPVFSGVPNDTEWHLKQTRVFEAWKLTPPATGKQKGEGIIVAHPDTGWREHTEYKPGTENILRDLYFDVRENKKGTNASQHPVVPQIPPFFPTHGTGTGCILASKEAGGKTIVDHIPADHGKPTRSDVRITGVAPNASIIPIRCVDGPILLGTDTNLQKAIEYAIEQKVHVISISLGGIPHRSLEDIIDFAVTDKKNDIIVVASAGQLVDIFSINNSVIEPAAYTNVIAAAGSNPAAHPWENSCHGPDVDIVAPSQGVWFANFTDSGEKVICWGEGTSFATPQVAGIAALWLAFWGRDFLKTRYPNKPLAHVFKHIITKTAWKPRSSWDSSLWGPGIIDAKAVLSEPLPNEDDVPKPAKQGTTTFSGITTFEEWMLTQIGEGQKFLGEAWEVFQNKAGELLEMFGLKEAYDYWEGEATNLWALAEGAIGDAQNELNRMAEAAAAKAEEAAAAGEDLLETITETGQDVVEAVGDLADTAGDVAEDGANFVVDAVDSILPPW